MQEFNEHAPWDESGNPPPDMQESNKHDPLDESANPQQDKTGSKQDYDKHDITNKCILFTNSV